MVLLCRMHLNHLYQICAEYNLNYDMRGQSYENLMKLLWSVNLTTMLLSESQEVTWKKRRSLVRLQRTTGNRYKQNLRAWWISQTELFTYCAKLILLLKSKINYATTIVRGCLRPVVAACIVHQNKSLIQRCNDEWVIIGHDNFTAI